MTDASRQGGDQTSPDPLAVRNKADWLWLAIEAQHERLLERVPREHMPSHVEVARLSNEFDSYIGAVNRLLRLAELTGTEVPSADLADALASFSAASPHVQEVRNTIEHFDAYSLGKGRRQEKKGEPISEFLFTVHPDEVVVTYASFAIPIKRTTAAARRLHRAIRHAVDDLSKADLAWDPPIA